MDEAQQLYATPRAERLINDAPGRLAIYREVVRRFDTAPLAIRVHSRFTRNHLFYRVAVSAKLDESGDSIDGLRETDRLLPLLRRHVSSHGDDGIMTDALALLRLKGEYLEFSGNSRGVLPYSRETAPTSERLMTANALHDPAYGLRSLAIDLDIPANVEAQLAIWPRRTMPVCARWTCVVNWLPIRP